MRTFASLISSAAVVSVTSVQGTSAVDTQDGLTIIRMISPP